MSDGCPDHSPVLTEGIGWWCPACGAEALPDAGAPEPPADPGQRDVAAKLSGNPEYQSALRDAESESWDGPGTDGRAMIDAATERRRQFRAGLRGGSNG